MFVAEQFENKLSGGWLNEYRRPVVVLEHEFREIRQ